MKFDKARQSGERIICKHPLLMRETRYDFSSYRYVRDYLKHICELYNNDSVEALLDCDMWEVEPLPYLVY